MNEDRHHVLMEAELGQEVASRGCARLMPPPAVRERRGRVLP